MLSWVASSCLGTQGLNLACLWTCLISHYVVWALPSLLWCSTAQVPFILLEPFASMLSSTCWPLTWLSLRYKLSYSPAAWGEHTCVVLFVPWFKLLPCNIWDLFTQQWYFHVLVSVLLVCIRLQCSDFNTHSQMIRTLEFSKATNKKCFCVWSFTNENLTITTREDQCVAMAFRHAFRATHSQIRTRESSQRRQIRSSFAFNHHTTRSKQMRTRGISLIIYQWEPGNYTVRRPIRCHGL